MMQSTRSAEVEELRCSGLKLQAVQASASNPQHEAWRTSRRSKAASSKAKSGDTNFGGTDFSNTDFSSTDTCSTCRGARRTSKDAGAKVKNSSRKRLRHERRQRSKQEIAGASGQQDAANIKANQA
jgi:hypothetical protein